MSISGSSNESAVTTEKFFSRSVASEPIAIVGVAGLFPMARGVREYWQNIVDGRDCTQDIPASRWNLADHYDPDPSTPDKTYSRRGGFLPDIQFAPLEFGLPPNQLEVTSVLQLLGLMVARDVLADAGVVGSAWYDPKRTGVVLGVTGPVPLTHPLAARLETPVIEAVVRSCGLSAADAAAIAEKFVLAYPPWEENSFPGLLQNVISGRIANRLDLGGLNCTVDAACASSLAAVRVAVDELATRRADLMITGGCDTENSTFGYMCFSKTQAMSRSGRIRPFDADADGTLVGEGIGMLALKRLADARRDGDRVYATIRGIGSSSDGRFTSIYAPRAEGQQEALRRAYADAGFSPETVELFEAHATGTAVGDATELSALSAVLGEATTQRRFAALGSVKSQIGHTKGAAGAASLIKLALGLYHKVLPPTINVERPNPALHAVDSPFYLNTRVRPWIIDPSRPRRRAAASGMGFGGTNFHVVLEEADARNAQVRLMHSAAVAYLWHAHTTAELIGQVRSGAAPITGEIPYDHARVGFAARSETEASSLREKALGRLVAEPDAMEWTDPGGVFFRSRGRTGIKVGAVFAGQGSQYVEMGLTAVLNKPPVAAAFDKANATFAGARATLAAVVFPPPTFEPDTADQEARLRGTEYAQPAIGALSVGQFRFLAELGLRCAAFVGHSFGELTALWAAGSLTDDDFFALARVRGKAMTPSADGVDPGTMAAVRASRDDVVEVLAAHPDVVVCNHNAPDQVVIGGGTPHVVAAVAELRTRGYSVVELPVAAAFHTSLVAHAVDPFAAAVRDTHIGPPRNGPVFANTNDHTYGEDVEANRHTLVQALRQPVELVRCVRELHAHGCDVFVEFGPRSVLTGLVERILAEHDVVAIPTDTGPGGDADLSLVRAAVQLAVLGAPVSDINRYLTAPEAHPEPQGMTVTLTGAEYVPAARRAAFNRALESGYRIAPPAVATASPPAAAPAPLVPVTGRRTDPLMAEIAQQHLALHNEYLSGQRSVAECLVEALRGSANEGADGISSAISAIAEHSIVLSQTHARVNDILASLTAIELPLATAVGSPTPNSDPCTTQPRTGASSTGELPVAAPEPATGNGSAAHVELDESLDVGLDAAADAVLDEPVEEPVQEAVNGSVDAEMLRQVVIEVVADKTGFPLEMVEPGMDLQADLGVDSIKRVQILGVIQERVPEVMALSPAELAELRTVADVVDGLAGAPGAVGGFVPSASAPPLESTADFPALPDQPADSTDPSKLTVELVRLPAVDRLVAGPFPERPIAVIASDDSTAEVPLAELMSAQGWEVIRLRVGIDGADAAADFGEAISRVPHIDACFVLLDGDQDPRRSVRSLADAVLLAGAATPPLLAAAEAGRRAAFLTLTRLDGQLGHSGVAQEAIAVVGGCTGLVKTLARESPGLFCRAVDVAPDADPRTAATAVLDEQLDAAIDVVEVGVEGDGSRRTPRWRPTRDTGGAGNGESGGVTSLSVEDTVLVTGGGRGVTATCVTALASLVHCGFLLLGRTDLAEEPEWAHGMAGGELTAVLNRRLREQGSTPSPLDVERQVRRLLAQREIRSTLTAVRDAGGRAEYVAVDITDVEATRRALAGRRDQITALVHGAGAVADSLLLTKTAAEVATVFGPKLDGLRNVLDALDDQPGGPLRHVMLFGSVAGVLGNSGQADYAAANEALGVLAAARARRAPQQRTSIIHWGAWDGGMVTPALAELFTARGVRLISRAAGGLAFADHLVSTLATPTSVLIGDAESLGGPAAARPPESFTSRRELRDLAADPVIQDHRIGEHPVLPAAAALGWMVNAVERANPGLLVVACERMEVCRGIVLDQSSPAELELVASTTARLGEARPEGLGVIDVVIKPQGEGPRGGGVIPPHFRATLRLAHAPDNAPPLTGWADTEWNPAAGTGWRDAESGSAIYQQGTLFHGPLLQGIRWLRDHGNGRAVAECALPDTPIAAGAYAGQLHSPALADIVLQPAVVLATALLGASCLPLSVGRVDYFARIPDGQTFVVLVDNARVSASGAVLSATACDPSGRVLQRFVDVTMVATPGLARKFAASVEARSAGVA